MLCVFISLHVFLSNLGSDFMNINWKNIITDTLIHDNCSCVDRTKSRTPTLLSPELINNIYWIWDYQRESIHHDDSLLKDLRALRFSISDTWRRKWACKKWDILQVVPIKFHLPKAQHCRWRMHVLVASSGRYAFSMLFLVVEVM